MRLIFDMDYRDSCRPVFKRHKLLTFPCIYILKCLLYAKQNIGRFVKNSHFHSYSTRFGDSVSVITHSSSKFEKSPDYASCRLFNHLPLSLRQSQFGDFKKAVKLLLTRGAYYSVAEYLSDAIECT